MKTRTLGWTQCGCFPLLLGQGWLQTAVSLLCGKREVLAVSSLGRCRVSPAQSSLVLFRTFSERTSILQSPEIARKLVSHSSGIISLNKTFLVE